MGASSQAKGDPVRLAMQAAAGAVAATIPCPLIMLCATQSSSAQVRLGAPGSADDGTGFQEVGECKSGASWLVDVAKSCSPPEDL